MNKKKILVLSDHPLSPSGVGTQTRYMIEALLKTGRYQFVCLGGAIKHNDYQPQQVTPYGEDWKIFPVDGYGRLKMKLELMFLWFITTCGIIFLHHHLIDHTTNPTMKLCVSQK